GDQSSPHPLAHPPRGKRTVGGAASFPAGAVVPPPRRRTGTTIWSPKSLQRKGVGNDRSCTPSHTPPPPRATSTQAQSPAASRQGRAGASFGLDTARKHLYTRIRGLAIPTHQQEPAQLPCAWAGVLGGAGSSTPRTGMVEIQSSAHSWIRIARTQMRFNSRSS